MIRREPLRKETILFLARIHPMKKKLIFLSVLFLPIFTSLSCTQGDPADFEGWWRFTSMKTDANTSLTGKDASLYMEIAKEGGQDLYRVSSYVWDENAKSALPLDTTYFTLSGKCLECGVETNENGPLYKSRTVYSLSSKTRLKGRAEVTIDGVKSNENSSDVEFAKVQNPGIR